MSYFSSSLSWVAALVFTIPLALLLLLALPSGAPLQIAMHALLLVGGAMFVTALRPDDLD